MQQAAQAVIDGADYIGVGPTFQSKTKTFTSHTGCDLIKDVTDQTTIPVFAIGGICQDNLQDVLNAGTNRIAVSAAVCQSDDPAQESRALKQTLNGDHN